MPHLTLQFSTGGPVLDVVVGVSIPRQQALAAGQQAIPQAVQVRGLIDTGASLTAIDPGIVASLGLVTTGPASVVTPTTGATAQQMDQYDVQLTLLHPDLKRTFQALPVIGSSIAHQGFKVLIGRDILDKCLLIYDGPHNLFSLAF